MIDHQKKFIFIHIPKTAGTSVSAAINGKKDHKHLTLSKMIKNEERKQQSSGVLEGYFTFAFVRNPWDRLVSLYMEKKETGWINAGVSFTDFVENVFTQPKLISRDPNLAYHAMPCSHWLTINGELAVNFVGRFENVEEDLSKICEKVGIKASALAHYRKRDREHYSTFYNDNTAALVADRYASDINAFLYSFGE